MKTENFHSETFEFLLNHLADEARRIATRKQDFIKRFNDNAAHALDWSNETFTFIAKEAVLVKVQNAMENLREKGKTEQEAVEWIMEFATKEAMRVVQFPSFSTSPTSNLMAVRTGQAWAEIVELFGQAEAM